MLPAGELAPQDVELGADAHAGADAVHAARRRQRLAKDEGITAWRLQRNMPARLD